MSSLEFFCSVVMLVSAAGCLLMLYAALALERQRRELSALRGYALASCRRVKRYREALTAAYGEPAPAVVVISRKAVTYA